MLGRNKRAGSARTLAGVIPWLELVEMGLKGYAGRDAKLSRKARFREELGPLLQP